MVGFSRRGSVVQPNDNDTRLRSNYLLIAPTSANAGKEGGEPWCRWPFVVCRNSLSALDLVRDLEVQGVERKNIQLLPIGDMRVGACILYFKTSDIAAVADPPIRRRADVRVVENANIDLTCVKEQAYKLYQERLAPVLSANPSL